MRSRFEVAGRTWTAWWLLLVVALAPPHRAAEAQEPEPPPSGEVSSQDGDELGGDPSFPGTPPEGGGEVDEPPQAPADPTPSEPFAYDAEHYAEYLERCRTTVALDQLLVVEDPCSDQRRASFSVLDEAIGVGSAGADGIPTGNYDIGYDAGAWNHFSRKVWGTATDGTFSLTKMLVGTTTQVLRWGFTFSLARRLAQPANDIALGYYGALGGGRATAVNTFNLALFATLVYFAVQALRGRTIRAAGELGVTYLILVLFVGFVIAVPNGFGRLVDSTLSGAAKLAGGIAATTLSGHTAAAAGCPTYRADQDADGSDAQLEVVTCPFTAAIHRAFVARPYDLLNWGADLGDGDDPTNPLRNCARARDAMLATGPHGDADEPRFLMGMAGSECERFADFNHDPTAERFGLAVLVLLTAVLVLLLMLLTALTLVGAQVLLVALVAVMPFAIVAGMLPGSGRSLLWRWATGVLRVVLVVLAVAVFLSLYLVSIDVLLDASDGEPWLVQGATLVLLTLVMFAARARLLRASERMAEHTHARLSAARVGGSHGAGLLTAAAGGWQGDPRGWRPTEYVPQAVRTTYRIGRDLVERRRAGDP